MNIKEIKKGNVLFYTREHTLELLELTIRTVEENYIVGLEKRDKQAFLLGLNEINKNLFLNRAEALEYIIGLENNNENKNN